MSLDPEITKRLDALMRADLESWSQLWFWVLVASTILVVLGILGELVEFWDKLLPLWKYLKRIWGTRLGRFDFNGWERLCPELTATRASSELRWVKSAAFVAWLVVMLGVAGEGVSEYFVNDAETERRAFDKSVLEETQKSATSAAEAASLANSFVNKAISDSLKSMSQSGSAMSKSTDALSKAVSAEASLGNAETKAKNAESSAASALKLARDARREAASFETDIARLKQQAADRVLDEYQQNQVKGRIFRFLGTPYELACNDASESLNLLTEIDAAVSSAGWIYRESENGQFRFTLQLSNGRTVESWHGRAVQIGFSKAVEARLKPAADALAKALRDQGVVAFSAVLPNNDSSPNNIHISVGGKP